MPDQQDSHWRALGHDIKKRWITPWGHPAFILYFLIVILLVGGLGVSISVGKLLSGEAPNWGPNSTAGELISYLNMLRARDMHSVPESLSTYLLAILATAFVDLSFLHKDSKPSLWMTALSLSVIGGFLAVFSFSVQRLGLAYFFAISGTMIALFLWWIANYDNAKLLEPPPPADAAIGGDPSNIGGDASIETLE